VRRETAAERNDYPLTVVVVPGDRLGLRAVYDDTGAIGKLYRRQDEIGTPWCVTVDFKTLEDQTVTVRDRDSMEQERTRSADLPASLAARLR